MRTIATLLPISAVAGVLALVAFAQDSGQAKPDEAPSAPKVGQAAHDFKATTQAGKEIQLHESFKGKVVLVDFWATWCPPCVGEIPHVKKAYADLHEQGLEVVGISLDREDGALTSFVEKREVKWPQIFGDEARAIAERYAVEFIPTAYLVDGDTGKVLASGNELRGDDLESTLSKHVKKKAEEQTKAKGKAGKADKSSP